MNQEAEQAIRAALETLMASKYAESRLMIHAEEVFLLFITTQRRSDIDVEAVSNEDLPAPLKLSAARANALRKLGFVRDGRIRNWSCTVKKDRSTLDRWPAEAIDIFQRIYGIEGQLEVELRQFSEEHPENQELVTLMQLVAGEYNEDLRRRLYAAMVNASLLVPLDPETGESNEIGERLLSLETLNGLPVFMAFSDWPSLRQWRPQGWSYSVLSGAELFNLAIERDAASIQINPDGDIGGELYRHEIEMLVEGVRKYRQLTMN